MSKSLTVGTPWKVILIFAAPILIGNVVQQLYQVIDAIVVGRTLGVDALAAVGATGAIFFLVIGFAMGLTTGFAIPTAQAFGGEDHEGVRRSVAAGTILTGLAGLILTLLGVFGSRAFLILLRTPDSLLDMATTFAAVAFSGTAAIMFFNYLSAILRARGDSVTPLVFLVISSLVNIVLVILFVRHLHWGIGGAAGATVAAQALSVLLCVIYIGRSVPGLKISKQHLLDCRDDLMPHLRLGLPMGFQTSIIAIGALVVQVRLNTLGPDSIAAFTTAIRVDNMAVAFLASLGLAASTFVAQNFGAERFDRIRTGIRQSLFIGFAAAVTLAFLLITFGTVFVRAFVGTGNDNVVSLAHTFLVVNGVFYVVLSVLFVTRGGLQGLGRMAIPTISGVLELLLRALAAIFLGELFGFMGVAWANPLAWIGATILLVPSWYRAQRELLARSELSKLLARSELSKEALPHAGEADLDAAEKTPFEGRPEVLPGATSEEAEFVDPEKPCCDQVL